MYKILFIDDSQIALHVLKNSMQDFAHVLCASSIYSAEKIAIDHPIDCVITDYLLVDGDAFTFTKKLRDNAQYLKTPVIIMSSFLNEKILQDAQKHEIQICIPKPILLSELKEIIQRQIKAPMVVGKTETPKSYCCSCWNNNGTYYQYSPDYHILVSGKTEEETHQKMKDELSEASSKAPESQQCIKKLDSIHHLLTKD